MLLEKEVMQKQKIQSLEAMLNTTVGRDVSAPLGRPMEPGYSAYTRSLEDLVQMAYAHSPEIKAKEQMVKAAEAKIAMARKEYYPDVTIGGTYFNRGSDEYADMWSLTATFNVPIYFQTKQDEAVREGLAGLSEAKHELTATPADGGVGHARQLHHDQDRRAPDGALQERPDPEKLPGL